MKTKLAFLNADMNIVLIFLLFFQVLLSGILLLRIIKLESVITKNFPISATSLTRVDGVEEDNDPSKGPETARIVIIEFSDFQCTYCAQAEVIIDDIIEQYPNDIKFVYRDFPLAEMHPDAMNASLAAECANEQHKFWEMHDKLFLEQQNLTTDNLYAVASDIGLDAVQYDHCFSTKKYENEVLNDIKDGKNYGVRGTPTFFINGYQLNGADKNELLAVIKKELDIN